jgi:hypothetical protein
MTKPVQQPVQTDQQTPPLALMENFKSLLPLLTSMAKESTIRPLSKEKPLAKMYHFSNNSPYQ